MKIKKENNSNTPPAFSTRGVAVGVIFVAFFALGVPFSTPPRREPQLDLRRDNCELKSKCRELSI